MGANIDFLICHIYALVKYVNIFIGFMRKIDVLEPKGYCAGVANAIRIAKDVKDKHPHQEVYVLGMLVHNQIVIDELEQYGIHSIYGKDIESEVKKLAKDSVVIYTAHGHTKRLESLVNSLGLVSYDAVCGKVKFNLTLINDYLSKGHEVIYIGKSGHPEALAATLDMEGVYLYDVDSEFDFAQIQDPSPLVLNQTTLNISSLKNIHQKIAKKIPQAEFKDEICNATRLRQENIINLSSSVDLILVVGDTRSSNSNRLLEIAKAYHPNVPSRLINSVKDLDSNLLENKNHIAIASGASTPISSIDMIVEYLNNFR